MKSLIAIAGLLIVFSACSEQQSKEQTAATATPMETAMAPVANAANYHKGDVVPNDEVCMVNDAFMGKKQLVVKVEGKTYYGCCEMCQQRIPQDQSVRVAIDPVSNKEVDKATALIAVTGDNGEVSYFESKTTYANYVSSLTR